MSEYEGVDFQPVTTGAIDIKDDAHKGKPIIGEYISVKTITTNFGEQFIYSLLGTDGIITNIYGFTMLNSAMDQLPPGQGIVVKITYKGTEKMKTKFGMKDVHQVDVQAGQKPPQKESTNRPATEEDVGAIFGIEK